MVALLAGIVASCGNGALPPATANDRVVFARPGQGASDARAMPALLPRYNEVQQKSVHNAYERVEAPFDQLVWGRARSLEFDVHQERRGHATLDGDWYVYHLDIPGLNATSCTKLSDCLGEMRAYHVAHPEHEVVTVMIDLKDDLAVGHLAADLDRRIEHDIGRGAIVTPRDLVSAIPGAARLQDALRANGWPRLDALRGKFLFAMTGGNACDPASHVSQYMGDAPLDRLGFAAPNVSDECPLDAYLAKKRDVGFLNMDIANVAYASLAERAGLVARVYDGGLQGGLDDEASWDIAKNARAQLLATNKVNFLVDPWAVTHNRRGWPFACLGVCPPDMREGTRDLGVTVDSDDLFGTRDGFFFASRPEEEKVTWSASISVAGSHTDDLGKACLMARASGDPRAPYFALCRTAAEHPLRVQYRKADGGDTETSDCPIVPSDTVTPASAFFARITTARAEGATKARAEASLDGVTWIVVADETIDAPLTQHGVAASSHGAGPMRFLFGGLTRAPAGAAPRDVHAAELAEAKVGACASGRAFDGVFQ